MNTFKKAICCTINLNLATRIIGFIGLAISVLLVTVLLNDRSANNYKFIRNVALALGLDWRHLHAKASTELHADPEGRMISIVVVFYSVIFLAINLLLLFAAALNKRLLTVPWLICEFLGCLSKLGALIFHITTESKKLSNVFVIGSVIYIVVVIWWWLVVFAAQSGWIYKKKSILHLSLVRQDINNAEPIIQGQCFNMEYLKFDSPKPYSPNEKYDII